MTGVNLFIRFFCILQVINIARSDVILDDLGFGISGYDGTFDVANIRARVLDLGALKTINGFQIRERVDASYPDQLYSESHTAEGFDEFATSLKTSVSIGGSFSGFKANIKSQYSSQITSRTDYYFSRSARVIDRVHMRIDTLPTHLLRELVIPHVESYLKTATPHNIFATYGTHITTRVIAGGMLELWSSSYKHDFSSISDFSASASASFKSLVEGSASLSIEERRKAQRVNTQRGILAIGGHLGSVGKEAEQTWITSTKANPETIKFLPGGAIPIWELIKDTAQAKRVQHHFNLVFGGRSIILKRFESTPVDIASRAPHPQAHVYVERGWKVISGGADVRYYGVGQLLTRSYPILSGNKPVGWSVGSKDHLKSDPGRIQAFAIAMWDPYDAFDVIVRTSNSNVAAHPSASVSLPSGYTLVGGGTNVMYREPGNMMVRNYPSSSNTWFSSSKDHARSAPSKLVSYAIGLKHRAGGLIQSRIIHSQHGPAQHPRGTLRATRGYSFVGAGAAVSRGGYGNMLVRIIPAVDGKSIYAYSKDHLEPDRQRLTIYGIEVFGATYVRETRSVAGLNPTEL